MLPSQAVALICVSSIFPVLAILAVALRVKARRISRSNLILSDYFIFFTLLNAVLNAIACIIGGVACGIGLPLSDLSPLLKVRFLKVLFVTQFFYIFSVWSVKVSVLLFYKSIFVSPGFGRAANATLVILLAWLIAFFFVTLFQDNPIPRNWGTVGTTINWRIFYIVEIATDVALDVFLICMPLPVIHRLRMNKKRKWMLTGIFLLGAFIIIASTVRLYYMVLVLQQFQAENDDFSFTTINTIIWGSIEPCTSVVAACLPTLGPVVLKRRTAQPPSYISSFLKKKRLSPSTPRQAPLTTDSIEHVNYHDFTKSAGFSSDATTEVSTGHNHSRSNSDAQAPGV